jgi:hypothetical protein
MSQPQGHDMNPAHPKLDFAPEFPSALVAEIEALFAPFLWLARDLQKLYISMKGSNSEMDGEADICTLKRYHIANISLDPSFWALSFEDKERTVLHELFHIVTDDYTRKVLQALNAVEDEGLKRYLYAFVSDAEEELVDRLAWDFYEFACADSAPSRVKGPRMKKVSA